MRRWSWFGLVLLMVLACGERSEPKRVDGDDLGAYLPDEPDLVVRVDLDRVRSWPAFATVSTFLLAPLLDLTTFVRGACGIDMVAEARTLLVARRGTWRTGDVTIVATGLAKLDSCRPKLGPASPLAYADGLYRVQLGGNAIASGKRIGDQLVFVQRAGKALDAATWTTLASRRIAPAWWSQLDRAAPVAARSATEPRVVLATIEPGDPLTARARLTSQTAQTAVRDEQIAKALGQYFAAADAGTLTASVAGTSVNVEVTATGPQIDRLIQLALEMTSEVPASSAPVPCEALKLAVEQYLKGAVKNAVESSTYTELQVRVMRVLPLLPKVFVDACVAGAWSQEAIRCHVETAAATMLSRFERCREKLTPEQLAPLDAATIAATKAATKP